MEILHQKAPNKDKDMKTARGLVLDFARRFDPSWLMAMLMLAVYAATRLDQTSITFASPALIEALLFGAGAIACFRPSPRLTFIASLPLAIYIGFAAYYGYSTHELSLAVIVLLAFAYGAHFWIHAQASALLVALRRIVELEAQLEAKTPGGVDVPRSE